MIQEEKQTRQRDQVNERKEIYHIKYILTENSSGKQYKYTLHLKYKGSEYAAILYKSCDQFKIFIFRYSC